MSQFDPEYLHQMAKEKTLKVQTETKTLETVLEKLQAKYSEVQSKELSDALTHLQAAIYAIKKV